MAVARASFSGWVLFSVFLVVISPSVSRATTRHVTYDPSQPEDRVGAVAAQAASGDTILIDPGTYYEHIPLEGKSLTFIGTAGAVATILDGSRELAGREGSIVYTLTGAAADLTLQGLTLRKGTGAHFRSSEIAGGAVCWWERDSGFSASCSVADCIFEDNTAEVNPSALAGGAIFGEDLDQVKIERSAFSRNSCEAGGGDISSNASATLITQCSFHLGAASYSGGSSIFNIGTDEFVVRECSFEAEASGQFATSFGLESTSYRMEIVDNQFIDRGNALATRMHLLCFCVGEPRQEILVARNTFWNAAGPDSAGPTALWVDVPNASLEISENTFVRCGMEMNNRGESAPATRIERNIIVRGRATLAAHAGTLLSCNDIWRTTVNDVLGNITYLSNIAEAPLFCNEPAGDLAIATGSPCAAEHSPSACGRIGALDPACSGSAVKPTTWGQIKSLFR